MPETKQTLHSAKLKKSFRSRSTSPSKKKATKSKSNSRSRSLSPKKSCTDFLSKPAMENAYYISHNAPQFLMFRGFSWDSGSKGRKRSKKKGKKK